ncbi:MAG: hypothetical protein HN731_14055 [Rhodospirillaceae bacterium]|nr:hypothetical protein [Rhodospirillaceae bacterium]
MKKNLISRIRAFSDQNRQFDRDDFYLRLGAVRDAVPTHREGTATQSGGKKHPASGGHIGSPNVSRRLADGRHRPARRSFSDKPICYHQIDRF